jgi:hypothetical protein
LLLFSFAPPSTFFLLLSFWSLARSLLLRIPAFEISSEAMTDLLIRMEVSPVVLNLTKEVSARKGGGRREKEAGSGKEERGSPKCRMVASWERRREEGEGGDERVGREGREGREIGVMRYGEEGEGKKKERREREQRRKGRKRKERRERRQRRCSMPGRETSSSFSSLAGSADLAPGDPAAYNFWLAVPPSKFPREGCVRLWRVKKLPPHQSHSSLWLPSSSLLES